MKILILISVIAIVNCRPQNTQLHEHPAIEIEQLEIQEINPETARSLPRNLDDDELERIRNTEEIIEKIKEVNSRHGLTPKGLKTDRDYIRVPTLQRAGTAKQYPYSPISNPILDYLIYELNHRNRQNSQSTNINQDSSSWAVNTVNSHSNIEHSDQIPGQYIKRKITHQQTVIMPVHGDSNSLMQNFAARSPPHVQSYAWTWGSQDQERNSQYANENSSQPEALQNQLENQTVENVKNIVNRQMLPHQYVFNRPPHHDNHHHNAPSYYPVTPAPHRYTRPEQKHPLPNIYPTSGLNVHRPIQQQIPRPAKQWQWPFAQYFPIVIKDPLQQIVNAFTTMVEYGPTPSGGSSATSCATQKDTDKTGKTLITENQGNSTTESNLKDLDTGFPTDCDDDPINCSQINNETTTNKNTKQTENLNGNNEENTTNGNTKQTESLVEQGKETNSTRKDNDNTKQTESLTTKSNDVDNQTQENTTKGTRKQTESLTELDKSSTNYDQDHHSNSETTTKINKKSNEGLSKNDKQIKLTTASHDKEDDNQENTTKGDTKQTESLLEQGKDMKTTLRGNEEDDRDDNQETTTGIKKQTDNLQTKPTTNSDHQDNDHDNQENVTNGLTKQEKDIKLTTRNDEEVDQGDNQGKATTGSKKQTETMQTKPTTNSDAQGNDHDNQENATKRITEQAGSLLEQEKDMKSTTRNDEKDDQATTESKMQTKTSETKPTTTSNDHNGQENDTKGHTEQIDSLLEQGKDGKTKLTTKSDGQDDQENTSEVNTKQTESLSENDQDIKSITKAATVDQDNTTNEITSTTKNHESESSRLDNTTNESDFTTSATETVSISTAILTTEPAFAITPVNRALKKKNRKQHDDRLTTKRSPSSTKNEHLSALHNENSDEKGFLKPNKDKIKIDSNNSKIPNIEIENNGSGVFVHRLKVRRGGVAIAGPGGIATAGSGGTAIVGPNGYAYTQPDSLAIAGSGTKVIAVAPGVNLSEIIESVVRGNGPLNPRLGKIVATGPVVYYNKG